MQLDEANDLYERAIGLWKSASVVSAGDTADIMAQLGGEDAAALVGGRGSDGGEQSDSVEVAYLMSHRRPLAAALSNLASVKRLLGDLEESGEWWHGGYYPTTSRPQSPTTLTSPPSHRHSRPLCRVSVHPSDVSTARSPRGDPCNAQPGGPPPRAG